MALSGLANYRTSRTPQARWGEWPETATTTDTVTDDVVPAQAEHSHHPTLETRIEDDAPFTAPSLDWLLDSQRKDHNPITGLPAGGWASSDAPGALPNAIDTSRALIALSRSLDSEPYQRDQIEHAANQGIEWLLRLQNEDGGWATFYRDPLNDELDESGADVTASAMRALSAWNRPRQDPKLTAAVERGWTYLTEKQHVDCSFVPRWFGNEYQPADQNLVIGTAAVLVMCAELKRLETQTAQDAARWLLSAQHSSGGWGPPRSPVNYSGAEGDGFRARRENEAMAKFCTVEETALAISALLPLVETNPAFSRAASQGLNWLVNVVEQDAHRRPAVLSFYPSKIWYHERLYPLVFSAEALSLAASRLASQRPAATPVG
jgi:squalene-hopene/tetraprenyl-beta-curcumene cyclase